jgi:methyltransferase (TIGR00027 family)
MAVSRTAEYVALYRALETHERSALFRDPFAIAFLPPRLVLAVRAARLRPFRSLLLGYADRRAPGARSSAIARTCYIDDVVRQALAGGAKQLVLLGAGFDCRAQRMPELEASVVFEVDRPDTQNAKQHRLSQAGFGVPKNVRYVAVDFLRDDVAERLAEAGWKREQKTIFVWEGVTNYLTRPAVEAVFEWIRRSAAASRVVFTYVHAGLLDGSVDFDGGARILGNVQRLGEPWTFGLRPHEVAPFLDGLGLDLIEDLGADDYRRRYIPGSSRGYSFYRISVAKVR